jgi:hypothetical protein
VHRNMIVFTIILFAIPAFGYHMDITSALSPINPPVDFLATEDFEADDGGYSRTGTTPVPEGWWHWGNHTPYGTSGNGSYWWFADSDSAGSVNVDEHLLSPFMDFSSAPVCSLWFYIDYNYLNYDDSVTVRASGDSGQTWINVVQFTADITGVVGPYDLSSVFTGNQFCRLEFAYNAYYDWGVIVDDVALENGLVLNHDVGVSAVYEPTGGTQPPGLALNPTARCENFGPSAESFNFVLHIYENAVLTGADTAVVSSLPPGDTLVNIFDQFTLGAVGDTYDFVFYTDLADDYSTNDSMIVSVVVDSFCFDNSDGTAETSFHVEHPSGDSNWVCSLFDLSSIPFDYQIVEIAFSENPTANGTDLWDTLGVYYPRASDGMPDLASPIEEIYNYDPADGPNGDNYTDPGFTVYPLTPSSDSIWFCWSWPDMNFYGPFIGGDTYTYYGFYVSVDWGATWLYNDNATLVARVCLESITDAGRTATALPGGFVLYDAYPNPFNPTTNIAFDLPVASDVALEVFDVLGRKVATLVDGSLPAGNHTEMWDASNTSSGVYFARLTTENTTATTKVTLLK